MFKGHEVDFSTERVENEQMTEQSSGSDKTVEK